MVGTITFKLRSSNHVGLIDVPYRVISCREIKDAIALKLSGSPEEIDIFVSGSTDYLHPDEELPAYSVVEVVRHVASGRPPPPKRDVSAPTDFAQTRKSASRLSSRDAAPPLTEEERLRQLREAVGAETGVDDVGGPRLRHARSRAAPLADSAFRPPPPGYICHNCGKRGHLIQHCPAAKGPRGAKLLSLPTGIPETMLVECTMDDPASKFVTRDGRLVKRRLDSASFTRLVTNAADEKRERRETPPKDAAEQTEGAWRCAWDRVLARNAMRAPCCAAVFCESCFNERVEEMISRDDAVVEPLLCPGCGAPLAVADVTAALEERKVINGLLSRKRERE